MILVMLNADVDEPPNGVHDPAKPSWISFACDRYNVQVHVKAALRFNIDK